MYLENLYKKLGTILTGIESNDYVDSGKSVSSGYMDFNFDYLEQIQPEKHIVAISHYYTQNGDMIADPDMKIVIDNKNKIAYAISYQDTFGFRSYCEFDNEGNSVGQYKGYNDAQRFLMQWLINLKNQKHSIKIRK
jgi:hypothetical protein